MNDCVVYTAISAGYDGLKPVPPHWLEEAAFVAFLAQPQNTPGWEPRKLYNRFRDPCRNAKIHKILSHKFFPQAQYTLWIDGSVQLTGTFPLRHWIERYLQDADLALFKHRLRNCIYVEAAVCLRRKLDCPDRIRRQMHAYRQDLYPAHHGLAECTIILRRHSPALCQFNEAWYHEIRRHSRRDQLSFNYVARKLGLKVAFLPGTMADNALAIWLPHNRAATRRTWTGRPN